MEAGGAGAMFWILTGIDDKGGFYPDDDGYRERNDGGPVARLLQEYAAAFAGKARAPLEHLP